jgi:hypothetical protein
VAGDYQQPDNSGSIFKNDRKTTDRHPDYKGTASINGVEYWVSGWLKTPKRGGNKYLSMAFSIKEERPDHQPSSPRPSSSSFDDFDDDIPF